ncbi:MAG: GAF domain-containing protein [Sphingomonas sp.]|nr:GAF domain-containing protein [Sphingomonas sp.]
MTTASGVPEAEAGSSDPLAFLTGGGDVARMMREHDWSQSPLGPIERWSPTLKSAVSMMLPADSQIVMFWGPDFAALYNDPYAPTIGDKHPHALGRPAREYWAELWDDLEPLLLKVRDEGETVSAKDRPFYIERHGFPETVFFDISYSAVRGLDGAIEGVLCLVNETTERVMAERDLRDSEERLRIATDAASIGTWDFDPISGRLSWDDRCKALFGLHQDAKIDYDVFLAGLHPDDRDEIDAYVRAALDPDGPGGYDVEYRTISPHDGAERWIAATGRALFAGDGADKRAVRFTGTVIDISEKKRIAEALIEQRRILETLNRTGEDLSRELELQKVVQMVTDAGVELSGAEFGAFFYNVLDEQGESYLLYSLSGAEPSQFNFGMPRNTAVFGPTFAGEGTIRSDDITKDPRYGKNAPHSGMPKGHLPVCSYLAVPVVSRSGAVIGGLFFGHHQPARFTETHEQLLVGVAAQAAIAIDNARLYQAVQRANETLEHRVEERTAELETANEALRQAQKMEAIGQLTGGIAHDFNNMLTVIRGSADVLQRRELEPDKRQRYLQAIAETSDRAARLTSQLLAFARRQALKPEVFSAPDRVEAITDMLRTVLGSRIRLSITNECDDCFIEADAAQFETALLNMAVNARDAMDSEGELKITIGESPTIAGASSSAAEHGYVTVGVTDSGHGISREDLDRIFEPFFTTKETGKGTGLGLSQVYGFAKQSGGEVLVTSKVGKGTTFTLFLPRSTGANLAPEQDQGQVRHDPRDGRVLVVEDNDEVGRFAEQVLADLGYRTRRAANALEALAMLEDGETFDVVFSDIVMPGQSGIDLAHSIRNRWPRLPIVLTSGYSDALAMRPDDNFPLLHKPYSLDALSAVLSEALKR